MSKGPAEGMERGSRRRYLEDSKSIPNPEESSWPAYGADIGRDTLALIRAQDAGYEQEGIKAGGASSDDDSDLDSDDETPAKGPSRDAPEDEAVDAREEQRNIMMDVDWDTTGWSLREVESACAALLAEAKNASADPAGQKRRAAAQKMLVRLLKRHREAVGYVENASDRVGTKRSRCAVRPLCAPHGAGVLLKISATFWQISSPVPAQVLEGLVHRALPIHVRRAACDSHTSFA